MNRREDKSVGQCWTPFSSLFPYSLFLSSYPKSLQKQARRKSKSRHHASSKTPSDEVSKIDTCSNTVDPSVRSASSLTSLLLLCRILAKVAFAQAFSTTIPKSHLYGCTVLETSADFAHTRSWSVLLPLLQSYICARGSGSRAFPRSQDKVVGCYAQRDTIKTILPARR